MGQCEIAILRVSMGLTMGQLARDVGVTQPTVARWVSGAIAVPTPVVRLLDYMYATGRPGSAADMARRWLAESWRRTVGAMTTHQLWGIAHGELCVTIDVGTMAMTVEPYSEYDATAIYVGDVCGMTECPSHYCNMLRECLSDQDQAHMQLDTPDHLQSLPAHLRALVLLVTEAERGQMLSIDIAPRVTEVLDERSARGDIE